MLYYTIVVYCSRFSPFNIHKIMKNHQEFRRKFRLTSWITFVYSTLIVIFSFLLAPETSRAGSADISSFQSEDTGTLKKGETVPLARNPLSRSLSPEVPREADFADQPLPEWSELAYLKPLVPATADFKDTCEVIKRYYTHCTFSSCENLESLSRSCKIKNL